MSKNIAIYCPARNIPDSDVGIHQPYPKLGPIPLEDVSGHDLAVQMLLALLTPGKHHGSHSQFDTIQKLHSTFANVWSASSQDSVQNLNIGYELKRWLGIGPTPSNSEWFQQFALECKKCMGQDSRQQFGISTEVMLALMN
jgi:hypothetical protein